MVRRTSSRVEKIQDQRGGALARVCSTGEPVAANTYVGKENRKRGKNMRQQLRKTDRHAQLLQQLDRGTHETNPTGSKENHRRGSRIEKWRMKHGPAQITEDGDENQAAYLARERKAPNLEKVNDWHTYSRDLSSTAENSRERNSLEEQYGPQDRRLKRSAATDGRNGESSDGSKKMKEPVTWNNERQNRKPAPCADQRHEPAPARGRKEIGEEENVGTELGPVESKTRSSHTKTKRWKMHNTNKIQNGFFIETLTGLQFWIKEVTILSASFNY
jgi:hypothetical protein